jgi:hypothetical protein
VSLTDICSSGKVNTVKKAPDHSTTSLPGENSVLLTRPPGVHAAIAGIWIIAVWEVRRALSTMRTSVLPLTVFLFILLVVSAGLAQQSGMHLQDGMYMAGIDDPAVAQILAQDPRFIAVPYEGKGDENAAFFDILILDGEAYGGGGDAGRSALIALEQDYEAYTFLEYAQQSDIFAAFPLWINLKEVKSELDFSDAGDFSVYPRVPAQPQPPIPELPVETVELPSGALDAQSGEFPLGLTPPGPADDQLARFSGQLTESAESAGYVIPSRFTPSLPFDAIVYIFVFIFPLYFTSQFFMMSVMQERLEKRGEILLSSPLRPYQIIAGKMAPYLALMCAISALLVGAIRGSPLILLPLFPVILLFLAFSLLIAMTARSFKELSFLALFFTTLSTVFLFVPSIFANIHAISLISPLTLVILEIQGDGFTLAEYLYSTGLFYLTAGALFALATLNFNDERLFSQKRLVERMLEFLEGLIRPAHLAISLGLISMLSIPFVFLAQMMLLVMLFNLPMPFSLILLLVAAAVIEEVAKSIGIFALYRKDASFLTWKRLILASVAVALGFLLGEKLLLFATLAQITESVFGTILFASLQVLWLPLGLHLVGICITAVFLKLGGVRAYVPGICAAAAAHALYNTYFILGWIG